MLPLDEIDRAKLRRQGQLFYVSLGVGAVGIFFAVLGVDLMVGGEWTGALVVAGVCLVLGGITKLLWGIAADVMRDLRAGTKERFATRIDGKRVRVHGSESKATYLLQLGEREDAVPEAEYRALSVGDEVFVERAPRSRLLLYIRPLGEADDATQLEMRQDGG